MTKVDKIIGASLFLICSVCLTVAYRSVGRISDLLDEHAKQEAEYVPTSEAREWLKDCLKTDSWTCKEDMWELFPSAEKGGER